MLQWNIATVTAWGFSFKGLKDMYIFTDADGFSWTIHDTSNPEFGLFYMHAMEFGWMIEYLY